MSCAARRGAPTSPFRHGTRVSISSKPWIYRLTFNTQAGCGSNSSGRSGSSIDIPPFTALNFSGAVDPSSVTDFAPVTSLR